ncbi:MAG TPA: GNVR domain-containing protein [Rhodoferax sp.]|jgi:polysaccharide chain length determinant protein (PEP-CTERM system associated)|nr:GNVR domain-containing protein [Rhodoferax sp.]HNY46923.1 GNVR domain-containing protein [Casimicrobium sp.]HPW30091.1 GNVR domain-containing protein [Rhodoferax sp.]
MAASVSTLLKRARWAVNAIERRRWIVVCVAWALTFAFMIGIAFIPERYEASARIYVDTQSVLKPLMVGLTYQPDIDQQVRMLARTLISRPNIERLLDQQSLDLVFKTPTERDKAVSRLMTQIKIVAGERGNLYQIFYRDPDRELAAKLVGGMVTLFVTSGVDGKTRDSVDAGHFIDEQLKSNETRLIEAENRLKDFKLKNFGVSGVSSQEYFTRMSTLSDEVLKLSTDLKAAERARAAYKRELSGENPQLPFDSQVPGLPQMPSDIDARLDVQIKLLDDLQGRYTDQHPDVINARRAIEKLEAIKRKQRTANVRDADVSDKGAATSPVYQKVRVALVESEAQVASLSAQLEVLQERLAKARALAGRAPQVEAELAQLNRDYEVIRKNYDQLLGRRESASLGLKLDESSQLVEFRMIEPPRVSPSPVFPSRLHLALMAVLLALVLGSLTALAQELLNPTMDDVKELQLLTSRPVLGGVSWSKSPLWIERENRNIRFFMATAIGLITCQTLWLAWIATQAQVN